MRTFVVSFLGFALAAAGADAADWPQWRGPNRDEVSLDEGLRKTWPNGGPRLLWRFEAAGLGFSGPAVVGSRLYTLGAVGDDEHVLAVDVRNGKLIWSTAIGPTFINGWGDGPRGTPTVDGDLLYAIGGQGNLVCVETAFGKKRWNVSLEHDLGGQMMSGWGYTESPLVDGSRVVCSPGGPQGTLAALDKKTGAVIWRSRGLTDAAAYSSMIVAEVGGIRQYIQMTSAGVVGVAARDGRLLWHSGEATNGTAIIPTPVCHDGYVYVTSGYHAGCALIKLAPDAHGLRAETVYSNKTMVNQHGGVVRVGELVYGYSDSDGWVCQEFKTGRRMWAERRKLGKGSLTYADGHLYCYSEGDGTVVLIEATPAGWHETGRFTIPVQTSQSRKSGQIWTHPVVANGRLYLRDQDLIYCYEISASNGG
jgi:outer membrane protein assembly factor BamB